jgi:sugar phosphate permease
MKPELSLAFAREAEQFGSLSAYCLYAYGLMQIPAGLLMDRFGPRRLFTLACAFCALGGLLFGIATTLWEAKFGRILIGVGASFAWIGCLKTITIWFPANRFAFMTGLTVTVGFLGAVFGLSTVSSAVALFGWRESMQWGGVLGLFLSVLLWLNMRDTPLQAQIEALSLNSTESSSAVGSLKPGERVKESAAQQTQTPTQKQTSKKVLLGLLQIIKNTQTWIAALYAGLMFVPTLAFGGLWGIPFLVEAHGFDRNTAGLCISLIYIGWVIGSPFWGLVSDTLRRRNPPMWIASIGALFICVLVIYLNHLPIQILSILLFALGFFSSGFILAFAVVQESNAPQNAGTAIGFTNALNTVFGAIAQPIIGKILDLNTAFLPLTNGERIFSLSEYQQALTTLPLALIVALILLFFLKETFCKVKDIRIP